MKRLLFTLIVLLTLAGCQSRAVTGQTVTTGSGSYRSISPAELNTMLKNKDFALINVHIPFAGNIAGTDLSIPYNEIDQHLSQLPTDKNARIVLYCRSGRMSQMAAETLVSLGYTNIWDLQGGMVAWEDAGYKIEE
jgi:rhodanese-related sulfurtransferase